MTRPGGLARRCMLPFTISLATACSTTATISRVSGPPIEANIIGGSEDAIYVQGESGGAAFPIERSDISDIDHPGNVHELVGGLLLAYGLANIAVGYSTCHDMSGSNGAAFCIGLFSPAVVGSIMMTWGLLTHSESVEAAHDRSRRNAFTRPRDFRPRPRPAPPREVPAEVIDLTETPDSTDTTAVAPSASVPEPPTPTAPPAASSTSVPGSSSAPPTPAPTSTAAFPPVP